MFKVFMFVCIYILVVIILALIIPPGIEDKSYSCIVKPDGYCEYPKVWNPMFVGGLVITTLIILVLATLSLTPTPDNSAYIMSMAEIFSKILQSEKVLYNIPNLAFIQFELVQPLDGGKKLRMWYRNPFDGNRLNILTVNAMSDYATSNTSIRQKSPLISWTNKPMSIATAGTLLSSRERDLLTKTIELEDQLNRRNLISGPVADIYQESLDQRRDKIRKQGEINGQS